MHRQTRDLSAVFFNVDVYKKRTRITVETLLLEANQRAKQENTQVLFNLSLFDLSAFTILRFSQRLRNSLIMMLMDFLPSSLDRRTCMWSDLVWVFGAFSAISTSCSWKFSRRHCRYTMVQNNQELTRESPANRLLAVQLNHSLAPHSFAPRTLRRGYSFARSFPGS